MAAIVTGTVAFRSRAMGGTNGRVVATEGNLSGIDTVDRPPARYLAELAFG